MKNLILKISILLIVLLPFSLYFSYETKKVEPDIENELRTIATKSFLENKIEQALLKDDIEDAKMYKNLADFLHIKINISLESKLIDANSFYNSSLRDTKNFFNGFITGNADNSVSLSGSVISDMTLVGDVRDMYKEGSKMVKDEPYDEFVLGIATLGITLTMTTYLSAGTTLPLKVGASIIKVAKKTKKLTKGFTNFISLKLSKTVDFKLLKQIKFSNIGKIENNTKQIINKAINLKPMQKLLGDVNLIAKNTSKIDTIKILKYVDKPKDIKKIIKLSNKFKKNTLVILKVLGKSALRGAKVVTKYTTLFITQIVAWIISFLGFLTLLILKSFFSRKVSVIT